MLSHVCHCLTVFTFLILLSLVISCFHCFSIVFTHTNHWLNCFHSFESSFFHSFLILQFSNVESIVDPARNLYETASFSDGTRPVIKVDEMCRFLLEFELFPAKFFDFWLGS
jgi:hypothetical protein